MVFPIFRANFENNLERKIDPRERSKFSCHYQIGITKLDYILIWTMLDQVKDK